MYDTYIYLAIYFLLPRPEHTVKVSSHMVLIMTSLLAEADPAPETFDVILQCIVNPDRVCQRMSFFFFFFFSHPIVILVLLSNRADIVWMFFGVSFIFTEIFHFTMGQKRLALALFVLFLSTLVVSQQSWFWAFFVDNFSNLLPKGVKTCSLQTGQNRAHLCMRRHSAFSWCFPFYLADGWGRGGGGGTYRQGRIQSLWCAFKPWFSVSVVYWWLFKSPIIFDKEIWLLCSTFFWCLISNLSIGYLWGRGLRIVGYIQPFFLLFLIDTLNAPYVYSGPQYSSSKFPLFYFPIFTFDRSWVLREWTGQAQIPSDFRPSWHRPPTSALRSA